MSGNATTTKRRSGKSNWTAWKRKLKQAKELKTRLAMVWPRRLRFKQPLPTAPSNIRRQVDHDVRRVDEGEKTFASCGTQTEDLITGWSQDYLTHCNLFDVLLHICELWPEPESGGS